MRQSILFTKTRKESPRDEESVNAHLLIRGGFVDKLMAGVYTFLPLGLRVFKKIENIIREEMIAVGGQEILMPVLQSKADWQATGRWDSLDSLIKFAAHYSKNEYALGPTHEEVVSPLLKKFIFSYKDMPVSVFQIQNKFRDEKRVKSGLLRGREFFMKDLYSFHISEDDLAVHYEKMKKAYQRVFVRTGIGKQTYVTFASGGSFSKYSHEFQTLTPAGEDVIFVCEKCKIAINREIINDQKTCPSCSNSDLREEKAIEVGNIFKLKTKYSAPFELKFKDKDGSEKDVVMGCYGIGLNRLIGTVVELHNDEKGIIWPAEVAPFKAHLLCLGVENSSVRKKADVLYEKLSDSGVEVLYDDRAVGAGEKFADADLIGIPYRFVISEKTGTEIEVKKRSEQKSDLVSTKEVLGILGL